MYKNATPALHDNVRRREGRQENMHIHVLIERYIYARIHSVSSKATITYFNGLTKYLPSETHHACWALSHKNPSSSSGEFHKEKINMNAIAGKSKLVISHYYFKNRILRYITHSRSTLIT